MRIGRKELYIESVDVSEANLQLTYFYINSSILIRRSRFSVSNRQLNISLYAGFAHPDDKITHTITFNVSSELYDKVVIRDRDGDWLIWSTESGLASKSPKP